MLKGQTPAWAPGDPVSFLVEELQVCKGRGISPYCFLALSLSWLLSPRTRLFYRYQDLAPQLVPLDYTTCPEVKVPYELIGSMPELKVCLGLGTEVSASCSYEVGAAGTPFYRKENGAQRDT